jgi:hypothetical protein
MNTDSPNKTLMQGAVQDKPAPTQTAVTDPSHDPTNLSRHHVAAAASATIYTKCTRQTLSPPAQLRVPIRIASELHRISLETAITAPERNGKDKKDPHFTALLQTCLASVRAYCACLIELSRTDPRRARRLLEEFEAETNELFSYAQQNIDHARERRLGTL